MSQRCRGSTPTREGGKGVAPTHVNVSAHEVKTEDVKNGAEGGKVIFGPWTSNYRSNSTIGTTQY